jgi:hypothetical protein
MPLSHITETFLVLLLPMSMDADTQFFTIFQPQSTNHAARAGLLAAQLESEQERVPPERSRPEIGGERITWRWLTRKLDRRECLWRFM